MNVNKIPLPKRNEIDTWFICGDWHSYFLHGPTYKILCKAALKIPKKQRKLIILGDFMDCHHLMKKGEGFQRWIKRPEGLEDYFIPETQKEFTWANEILDHLQKIFPTILYTEGNHENRLGWFTATHCPVAYRHNFCTRTQLNLRSRGIFWTRHNSWIDIGKVSLTHGMFHGSTCIKKTYEASGGRSTIFGHVHRFECRPFASRGETRQTWSIPCMARLNPEYLKNVESNWSNGFGVLNVKSNGNFNFNVFQVWDGELVWPDGKIISGEG